MGQLDNGCNISKNPSTGEVLGQYSAGGRIEGEAAIAAARKAFDAGAWSHDPQLRSRAIFELAVGFAFAPFSHQHDMNSSSAPSSVRRIGAAISVALGVAFFFAIIGVFGLSTAIGSLALYIALVVAIVLRARP